MPLDRCRYDIGVEVPEGEPLDTAVQQIRFPAMTVVEVPVRGGVELELQVFDWLYTTWLPARGCVPDSQPCFEAWDGEPFAHGVEHFELRVQLPLVEAGGVGLV